MGRLIAIAATLALASGASQANAQAWRNCVPNSIGPGGCDSIGPGGGKSIGPGGGLSIGPGGGLSIGPEGGQSIGPRGGRSIGPGGGMALDRDWSRGLDPDTMRPAPRRAFGLPSIGLGGHRGDLDDEAEDETEEEDAF